MATTFKALRAVRFGAKDYCAGDKIPAGVVLAKRERALINMGIIAKLDEESSDPPKAAPKGTEDAPTKADAAKSTAKK